MRRLASGEPEEEAVTRIDELWAWVAEDKGEGVMAAMTQHGWVPLVAADLSRIQRFRTIAEAVAAKTGKAVRLVRFAAREVVEELTVESLSTQR